MKHFKTIALSLLVSCAVLVLSMSTSAQLIDSWMRTEHDFGDVVVGEANGKIFTVTLQDYSNSRFVFPSAF